MASILEKYTGEFNAGRELASNDAEAVLDALISELDETPIANLLTAWNAKGIEEDEIYEFARILRSRMIRVNSRYETFVDIVGTGGSKAKTFNVSTAAAFVVAGAGIPVAKHGNKAATSNSGSADVLAELGINPAVDPETAERCLNEVGICFMFAPNHHRLSPTLAKVRRGLGFPTILNCVGPLCNPASAPHQLIGVWDRELLPKMAGALARLGTKKSWVVHGEDGLDEISMSRLTLMYEIDGSAMDSDIVVPGWFALEDHPHKEFEVRSAAESARLIRYILEPESPSPARNFVCMNAAAAIYLTGRAEDPVDALDKALDSIISGNARRKLEELATAIPV